jgi:hypothetical protein
MKHSAAARRIAQHVEAGLAVVCEADAPMTAGGGFEGDRRADFLRKVAERVIDLAVSDAGGGHHMTSMSSESSRPSPAVPTRVKWITTPLCRYSKFAVGERGGRGLRSGFAARSSRASFLAGDINARRDQQLVKIGHADNNAAPAVALGPREAREGQSPIGHHLAQQRFADADPAARFGDVNG